MNDTPLSQVLAKRTCDKFYKKSSDLTKLQTKYTSTLKSKDFT